MSPQTPETMATGDGAFAGTEFGSAAILETVPRLGIREGGPLVVDLTSALINTWDELRDALVDPCGLPEWFGRNLDAWNDTLSTGAISAVLDAHPFLIVRVLGQGLFAPGNDDGLRFVEVTAQTGEGRVDIEG